jgi:hypothetical protein
MSAEEEPLNIDAINALVGTFLAPLRKAGASAEIMSAIAIMFLLRTVDDIADPDVRYERIQVAIGMLQDELWRSTN